MSIYFRWGGAALIMICALLIDREYKQYLTRRISENCGFLSLVSHAEAKISKFLCHGDGLWRDFSDDALTKCGFLPALQSGASVADSFEQCCNKTALSKEAKKLLSDSFKEWGKGYRDGEVAFLSSLKEKIASLLDKEKTEAEKSKKITTALLFGGALSILIMAI